MAIKYFVFFTVFLLLNIFLAIFGTFWYRTQQRHSEIAIFKALGANNRNIFMREISESIILLSIATIPAIIIDWNMAFAKLNTPIDEEFLTAGKFITTIVITWLLMAIILILGSWFPARKAMKIQPAVALHED